MLGGDGGGGSKKPKKHEKSVLENPDILLQDKGPHCKHCAGLPGPCKSNMWKSETGLTVCMDYLHATGKCPHGFKDCFNHAWKSNLRIKSHSHKMSRREKEQQLLKELQRLKKVKGGGR